VVIVSWENLKGTRVGNNAEEKKTEKEKHNNEKEKHNNSITHAYQWCTLRSVYGGGRVEASSFISFNAHSE